MEHDMSRPVLESLCVSGLNRLEPIILAALAGESTLLLIGEHGSGKSMLLERIAAAFDGSGLWMNDLAPFEKRHERLLDDRFA